MCCAEQFCTLKDNFCDDGFYRHDLGKRFQFVRSLQRSAQLRAEEKISYTETQSHPAQKRRLHREMIRCSLIHHLGDVLVNIRASCLDPVIRVGRRKHHISVLECKHTNVALFQFVMRQKIKHHLSSRKENRTWLRRKAVSASVFSSHCTTILMNPNSGLTTLHRHFPALYLQAVTHNPSVVQTAL